MPGWSKGLGGGSCAAQPLVSAQMHPQPLPIAQVYLPAGPPPPVKAEQGMG